MGHEYDEHMEIIEEEISTYGYEGSFRQSVDMGGPPMVLHERPKNVRRVALACVKCGFRNGIYNAAATLSLNAGKSTLLVTGPTKPTKTWTGVNDVY